jgi:hypothetical protein
MFCKQTEHCHLLAGFRIFRSSRSGKVPPITAKEQVANVTTRPTKKIELTSFLAFKYQKLGSTSIRLLKINEDNDSLYREVSCLGIGKRPAMQPYSTSDNQDRKYDIVVDNFIPKVACQGYAASSLHY